MEKRDAWEEAIRSKLADYEAQPDPADWEALRNRLTHRRLIPRRWMYAAAAVVLLAVLFEGGRRLWRHEEPTPTVAEARPNPAQLARPQPSAPEPIEAPPAEAVRATTFSAPAAKPLPKDEPTNEPVAHEPAVNEPLVHEPAVNEPPVNEPVAEPLVAEHPAEDAIDASDPTEAIQPVEAHLPAEALADAPPVRRWGFGMGGGGYTTGLQGSGAAPEAVNARDDSRADLPPYGQESDNLSYHGNRADRIGVKHARPLSIGLGVSYRLSDRWSLQSGLTYTCLTSRWNTISIFDGHARQRLHFVGIPVGVAYRIADWQRVRFYAGAGGAVEWNVAGNLRTVYHFNNERRTTEQAVRMKEWQWSVYTHAGASYPLLRVLSLFAEVGANYYFDNGSPIETIRSEHPLDISLRTGLRIGF